MRETKRVREKKKCKVKMKYLKVEGAGRLRLSGGIIGLGSTSRRQGEEGIFDPIYAIPISDPTSEAEAMS